MVWGSWFCEFFFKSLIGLSPIWFVCVCVSPVWHSKHVLRHFHLCSCIVHWCSSLLHAMCLTECSCDILMVFWTQLCSIPLVYPWLYLGNMFWSISVCFTHFPYCASQCLALHHLGTHNASPATLTCISSCTHMHTHAHTCTVTYFHALCFCLHVLTRIACCFEFVMLCFKLFLLLFWTNLNLIKFCGLFCVCAPVSFLLFSV